MPIGVPEGGGALPDIVPRSSYAAAIHTFAAATLSKVAVSPFLPSESSAMGIAPGPISGVSNSHTHTRWVSSTGPLPVYFTATRTEES